MSFQPLVFRQRDQHLNPMADMALPGPEGVIRFAVGEPGKQSAIWRIFAPNPDTFDVYVGARAMLQWMKWSLHQSGNWRFGWVESEKALTRAEELVGLTDDDDRAMFKWDRPEEIRNTGLTRGLEIRVRHQDLIEVAQPEKAPADTIWIPAPPVSYKTCLAVFIARAKQPEVIDVPTFHPLAGISLADGRAALLIAEQQPLEPVDDQLVALALPQLLAKAREAGADLTSQGLRALLRTDSVDGGDQLVYDVAVPPEPGPV